MTAPTGSGPDVEEPGVPEDVVTGFWCWAAALPLLTCAYVVDAVVAPVPGFVRAFSVFFAVALFAITLAFLVLLRLGYRWARTMLTGGGVASIAYVTSNLFTASRPEAAAPVYAVCAIVGSVLVAGGVYLLHRAASQDFFTR